MRKLKFLKNIFLERKKCTGNLARLYPPLRDAQQLAPAAVCPNCGGEQYSYDIMLPVGGGLWCAACAGEETQEEAEAK